jgi:phenylpropionate dioxygenase-like ring-hydroxylating dioxygenase large terminal subunit
MIRNQWYAALSAKEVKRNSPVGVVRFGEKLVLWRDREGKVCCIADKCCHRGASLSCGKITEGHVACPFHGFQYAADGKVVRIPANGKQAPVPDRFHVRSYPVREAWGFIWLWYGDIPGRLPDIPFFEDLKQGFACGEFSENWNVHYSRAIENQLDVVHLPFVHASTIGRGNKTLVNGPVVKWDGTLMTFYVKNAADSGQKPERPEEIKDIDSLYYLKLQMPNLWQNVISPKMRIMAAFAPVDEENTRIYLRYYHSFLKAPVLRELMNAAGNMLDRIVLHQDRKVVLTQIPKRSELSCGENLVQGDLPIIEYRKMRQKMKTENG